MAVTPPDTRPRGIRLNNPGNLEKTPTTKPSWMGEVRPSEDARFAQFLTMSLGIRAMGKILLRYQNDYGLKTTAARVARWAPPSENNTRTYTEALCERLHVGPDDVFDLNNELNMSAWIKAQARVEQGGDFLTASDLAAGMDLLFHK